MGGVQLGRPALGLGVGPELGGVNLVGVVLVVALVVVVTDTFPALVAGDLV